MATFKSVPGSQAPMGIKFNKDGFYTTTDEAQIAMLSKMNFVETIGEEPKEEKKEEKPKKASK